MAIVFDDLIIDRVLNGVFRNSNGDVIGGLNQLTGVSINTSSETKDKTDAQGTLIKRFYTSKSVEFSAENAVVSLNLMALQTGSDKLVGSSANKIVVPRIMVVDKTASPITLKEDPIAGTLSVTGCTETGVPSKEYAYTKGTQADTDKYAYDSSSKDLALPTNATNKVQIVYMYESANGAKVVQASGNFPKTCELILSVLVCDACDTETLRHAYVVFPSFQMSPDFDLSLDTESNHPFSGTAQVDYCGGEQQLFYIAISEDDVE